MELSLLLVLVSQFTSCFKPNKTSRWDNIKTEEKTTTECCLGDSAVVHKLSYSQFVETDDHCTASLWKEMITVKPIVKRWSLSSQLWKKMITVQCTTICGKRCTLYSLMQKEMITVQPTVERDTVQCTAYCGKRYSLYSVQPIVTEMITVQPIVERDDHCTAYCHIVERDDHRTANCGDDHCTANCGQRWSLYSLL